MKLAASILLLTLLTLAQAVSAQHERQGEVNDSARVPFFDATSGEKEQLANRLNFIRQLMRSRNFEDAAAMAEQLYEDQPDDPAIVGLLVQCYDQLQQYEKSEAIIERYLSRDPQNFNFRLLYAEVLSRQGNMERARQAYLDAASQFALNNTVRYQTVIQSMVSNNMGDAALPLIDSLRLLAADSTLFAVQRGTVLERQKRYGEAACEFYPLLQDTGRVGNDAERRLAALLDFGDSQPAVESVFVNHADLLLTPRALRIISAHYLKSGQYDRAFEFSISRDSLEGDGSEAILAFMQNSFERQLFDQTVRGGEYLLAHYDTADMPSPAQIAYGKALAEMGRAEEAIAVYGRFCTLTERAREKAQALYLIGMLYLDNLGDFDRALTYFDSVESYYGGTPSYQQVLIVRPHCYLRQGELDRARTEFEKALSRPLLPELKEEALYYAALVDFFQKQFDSTRADLGKLLVDYPGGRYVNDAVRLLFTLDEADGSPDILYDYSNVLLFEQRRMTDSAFAKLAVIAEAKDSVLADLALFELARLSLDGDSADKAIAYIDRLNESFPESYYLPYGLKIKADVLSSRAERAKEAGDIYRRLLQDYPNFPFLTAVRLKLRQLDELYGSS